jgi:hypothetical protein
MSETGVGPGRLGGGRGGRDVGGVRRELDDQRLAGERPHAATTAPSSRGSAPMSRPVFTFGQETFSSIASISARGVDRLDERGDLVGGRAHHVRDERHR